MHDHQMFLLIGIGIAGLSLTAILKIVRLQCKRNFLGYPASINDLPFGKKFYVKELSTSFSGAFLEKCDSSGRTNVVIHVKDFTIGIKAGQFVIVVKTERGEKMLVPLKQ